jgi:hypothetical protein
VGADELDPVERLLAERACERLVYTYARLLDFGDEARVPDLFTDDGVWEMPGRIRFAGRAELEAGIPTRLVAPGRTARHVCTNVTIDVLGPDEAVGFSYMINYRHDPPSGLAERPAPSGAPVYMGEYHDRFVRTPDGWRFALRRTELAFAASAGAG